MRKYIHRMTCPQLQSWSVAEPSLDQKFLIFSTMTGRAPLSMGFSRQEHWSGLSLSRGISLTPDVIESTSLMSPETAGEVFTHN